MSTPAGAAGPAVSDDGSNVDFYALLGVQKTATEKEIATAYKKLALKYHPDRTRGDEEAAEKFKAISTAYAVLSDPNKRRQYDLSGGSDAMQNEFSPVDMESVGGVGPAVQWCLTATLTQFRSMASGLPMASTTRVMGALIGKLGVTLPTSIAQASLTAAHEICQQSGLSESNPRVIPMRFGVEYKGTVEKQQSHFFLLRVSNEVARDGLVLKCVSSNKSRFKLVVFDGQGKVRYQEESTKGAGGESETGCSLFFTPFEMGMLAETMALPTEEEVPPVFHRLDTFTITRRELGAGDHLVCVYGDNWLRAANFNCMAIPLHPSVSGEAQSAMGVDQQLLAQRASLQDFKGEFLKAKANWEATLAKLEEMTKQTQELIHTREALYNSLVTSSLRKQQGGPGQIAGDAGRGRARGSDSGLSLGTVNVNQTARRRAAGGAAATTGPNGGGGGEQRGGGDDGDGLFSSFGRFFAK